MTMFPLSIVVYASVGRDFVVQYIIGHDRSLWSVRDVHRTILPDVVKAEGVALSWTCECT